MLVCTNNDMSRKKKKESKARESIFSIRVSEQEKKMFNMLSLLMDKSKSDMIRILVSNELEKRSGQELISFK